MKRSELLETAIETEQAVLDYFRNANDKEICDINQLTLDILLAEQKREEGCDYCNQVIPARNSSFGIYQSGYDRAWHISTDESDEDLYFCPKCGRRLTDGESE